MCRWRGGENEDGVSYKAELMLYVGWDWLMVGRLHSTITRAISCTRC